MKKIYKYTALAVLALGFTACSQDDDFAPQQEDIVKITSANIATEVQTRVNTLDDGTLWENNDQILLINNSRTTKNSGTYTATVTTGDNSTTTWQLTNGTVLYTSGNNDFTAYYPAVTEADYTLPTDQSTVEGIKLADRMVATATSVAKGDAVALSFERQHAKIAITPTLATEFTGKSIGSLLIAGITPYHPEEATDYTAIITPSETGFSVSVTVDGQSLTAASSTKIEAGKHYTFDLKVGMNAIQIMNVSVTKWNEIKINDVESNEYISPNVDATSMTSEELKAAVLKKIKMGQYDIIVTLAADADEDMFTALRTALAESTIPDGNINLTISGVKKIPEEGFIDMLDYFDNGDKNIAGDKLKSLTLTDVETIGEYAFSACTNLEVVNMPKVVTIGEYAFNEWRKGTKLTSLDLPNVTTIGLCAFAYSSLLTSVNLPQVVTIGEGAFEYCDLRTLDFPEATTIGGGAFEANYNLVSCSAPKATTIGYYPWGDCSKLGTLELTAAGDFTISNNYFADTPTGQINLVLNKDKESQVTQNDDGTATWNIKDGYGNFYTFKSITFKQ